MEGEEQTRMKNFTLNTQNGFNITHENLMEKEELQEKVKEIEIVTNICTLNPSTEEMDVQVCSNKTEIAEKLAVTEINESFNLTERDENVCSLEIYENSTIITINEDSDQTEVSENFSENSTTEHEIPIEIVEIDCGTTIAETVHNLEPYHSDSNVVQRTQHSCPSCSCVSHENGSFVNPNFERDSADIIAYNHTDISHDGSGIPSAQEVNVIVEQDNIYRQPSSRDLPTYSSLILNDEPPKYEDVTGIKLSMGVVSVILIYYVLSLRNKQLWKSATRKIGQPEKEKNVNVENSRTHRYILILYIYIYAYFRSRNFRERKNSRNFAFREHKLSRIGQKRIFRVLNFREWTEKLIFFVVLRKRLDPDRNKREEKTLLFQASVNIELFAS